MLLALPPSIRFSLNHTNSGKRCARNKKDRQISEPTINPMQSLIDRNINEWIGIGPEAKKKERPQKDRSQ